MEDTIQDVLNISVESIPYYSDNDTKIENQEEACSLWTKLKPQYKERIFHVVLNSPNIPETVRFWMEHYETDEATIITEFVQFVIDLASYQFINIKNFLRDNEITNIVPHMEEVDNPVIQKTGKYFLKCRSKSYLFKQKKIEEFIVCVVKEIGLEYDLFQSPFHRYCVRLIKDMCGSKKRSIRHTGIFFGLKYITGIVGTMLELRGIMETCAAEAKNEEDIEQKRRLSAKYKNFRHIKEEGKNQIIQLTKVVLRGNCDLNDVELTTIKRDFTLEISYWTLTYPKLFIDIRTFDLLLTYLTDSNKEIRLTALTELGKILEKFYKELEVDHPQIIKKISDRVYDLDVNIASLAVLILSFLYKHTGHWISNEIRDKILCRVYCFDYQLASACGTFLINVIEMKSTKMNDILLQLIKFEMSSNYRDVVDRVALLVESIFDALPMLQDLSVFKSFLEETKLDEPMLRILINILTEVVHQIMTGRCTLKRKNARKGDKNAVDTLEFCTTLEDILLILSKIQVSSPKIMAPIFLAYRKFIVSDSKK